MACTVHIPQSLGAQSAGTVLTDPLQNPLEVRIKNEHAKLQTSDKQLSKAIREQAFVDPPRDRQNRVGDPPRSPPGRLGRSRIVQPPPQDHAPGIGLGSSES